MTYKVPTQLPFGEAWIAAYFDDVDTLKTDALLWWYAEDSSFRFANHAPVQGRTSIAAALDAFFSTLVSMKHQRTGVWVDLERASAVWEAEVSFVCKNGVTATLPAMSVLRLDEESRIRDFRFVMDSAPLAGESH